MTSARTDAIITTTLENGVGTMNENMFGAIGVNNFGWHYFEDHTEDFGLTNIRWPGGTVAETGWVVDGRVRSGGGEISLETLGGDRSQFAFDLTHPELMSELALTYDELNHLNRDDVGTFSQVLALAVDRGVDVELIIPIQRYFLNEDLSNAAVREEAVTAAVSDITIFLERLKNGDYNNGSYPQNIIFDIGNEQYSNPIEAAIIGRAIAETIAKGLLGTEISYGIGFQMGRGEFEYDNLYEDGYFDPFFDGGDIVPGLEDVHFVPGVGVPNAMQNIFIDMLMIEVLGDSLVHFGNLRHHVLGFSEDALDGDNAPLWQRGQIVEYWMDAFEELGIDPNEIEYNISAFTTDSSNGNFLPYELSGAANTLQLYDYMMQMGVDRASIWGVVGAFTYNDNMLTTTVSDRSSDFDSPQAAIIRLLSENVMNSDYIGAGGGDIEGYHSFTYQNETSYSIFFYVEDVNSGQFTLDVDLGLLGDLQTVSAINLDIANGALNGAAELTSSQIDVVDGVVQLTFDQDFEIVMLTLNMADSFNYQSVQYVEDLTQTPVTRDQNSQTIMGSETSEQISGGAGSDFLYGMQGNDSISGGAGRGGFLTGDIRSNDFDALGGNNGDFMFGGEGNDVLYGNAGNDLISGDEGNDELWGGGGFDTFVFTEGLDIICDFDVGVDTIVLDSLLVDQEQELEVWLGNNATTIGDTVVINFGEGNELAINGLTDVSELFGSVQLSRGDELSF